MCTTKYSVERATDDGWKAVVIKADITFTVAMLIADHASESPEPTQAQVIDYTEGEPATIVAVYEAGKLIVLNGKAV
jgi:hypothetical protein